MTTETTAQETNLYITVVPKSRIYLTFFNYPTLDALSEVEKIVSKYPGLVMNKYILSNLKYVLTGDGCYNLEQIGREIKKHFEALKFSFNVKGQIDLDYTSIDL